MRTLLEEVLAAVARARPLTSGPEDERLVFEAVYADWAPNWMWRLAAVQQLCDELHETEKLSFCDLLVRELRPQLGRAPLYRRAFAHTPGGPPERELVHAYLASQLEGQDIEARFLHFLALRDPIGTALRARHALLVDALRDLAVQRQPCHVLCHDASASLECELAQAAPTVGGAIELAVLHGRKARAGRRAAKVSKRFDALYLGASLDGLVEERAREVVAASLKHVGPGGAVVIASLRESERLTWWEQCLLKRRLTYREPAALLRSVESWGLGPLQLDLSTNESALLLQVRPDPAA